MKKPSVKRHIVVIGAGPAGLAAAYELVKHDPDDYRVSIYESENQVGGIAKTLEYQGYRFDLGGHRFYSKYPEINDFYQTFLGKDMLERNRLSRIYYEKKFFNYPISAMNSLIGLGVIRAIKIFQSWLLRQFNRYQPEKTFAQWVSNRFGDELFKIFFKSYTEKVWGISTSKLSADWAAQRIQDFDLLKAVVNAVFKTPNAKTVIDKFFYPKYGPGMLYGKMQQIIEENGGKIYFGHEVTALKVSGKKVAGVVVKNCKSGSEKIVLADMVVSTMPFERLTAFLKPRHKEVISAVSKLSFRNFITVNLVVKSNPFPDQWIYVHDPTVGVGRIQNFRNWSPFMVKPSEDNTPIGMEYFTSEGDSIWLMSDQALVEQAKKEIVRIGLVKEEDILDGFVYRVRNAYPVYNSDYQKPLAVCRKYVEQYENLYPCGRGGLFRYNNQDHSILTGFYVARNIQAGRREYDVWGVNEEKDYLEAKNSH